MQTKTTRYGKPYRVVFVVCAFKGPVFTLKKSESNTKHRQPKAERRA